MYNPGIKLKSNVEAIKIALECKNGEKLKSGELEKLKAFSGWGGIKCILYNPYIDDEWKAASEVDKKLQESVKELHELLKWHLTGKEYKESIDSMRNAVLSSFYTPAVIPSTFYTVLSKFVEIDSIYDPSCGGGVFITEAASKLRLKEASIAVEKDTITQLITKLIVKSLPINIDCIHIPFEETSSNEDGKYQLITSNIPFGAIPVFDIKFDRNITSKLHNYFFAKGLMKIKEGGLLAYLVTSAFLDTPTNKSAREYVFSRADFISLTVMPDNLMKESANTKAPSHFLVVRKNSKKTEMSEEEKLLCVSENITVQGITFSLNKYYQKMGQDIVIGDIRIGKNQYGKPCREVWWSKPIDKVGPEFSRILQNDFRLRYIVKLAIPYKGIVEMPLGPVIKLDIKEDDKFKWKPAIPINPDTPPWEDKPVYSVGHGDFLSIEEAIADKDAKGLARLKELSENRLPWEEQEIEEESKAQIDEDDWNKLPCPPWEEEVDHLIKLDRPQEEIDELIESWEDQKIDDSDLYYGVEPLKIDGEVVTDGDRICIPIPEDSNENIWNTILSEISEEDEAARLKDVAEMEMGEGKYADEDENNYTYDKDDTEDIRNKYKVDSISDIFKPRSEWEGYLNDIETDEKLLQKQLTILLSELTIPFKPGMFIVHDEKLIQLQEIVGEEIRYVVSEMSKKEIEVMTQYLQIRDNYVLLEQEEQNQ